MSGLLKSRQVLYLEGSSQSESEMDGSPTYTTLGEKPLLPDRRDIFLPNTRMGNEKIRLPKQLAKAVKLAKNNGVPERIVNGVPTIALEELRENSNCPVPDALAAALLAAANNTPGAIPKLVQVLDKHSSHFNIPT